MKQALALAAYGADLGEVPVGAVVVKGGEIIGRGYNRRQTNKDITGHAEIMALTEAAKTLGDWRLDGCDLYVSLEPCAMCAGAIMQSRIRRVYFGAFDPGQGAVCSKVRLFDITLAHRPDYEGGVLAEEATELLKKFFAGRREQTGE